MSRSLNRAVRLGWLGYNKLHKYILTISHRNIKINTSYENCIPSGGNGLCRNEYTSIIIIIRIRTAKTRRDPEPQNT